MENNYFIYTKTKEDLRIERFHICQWEFRNKTTMIEFGAEIESQQFKKDHLDIYMHIPWLNNKCGISDLYKNISAPNNCRFVFNDSIISSEYFDGGRTETGVLVSFQNRNQLCLMPIRITAATEQDLKITINLKDYGDKYVGAENGPNIYFRFKIMPNLSQLSVRKDGISKSTILYDVKINESRNMPRHLRDKSKELYLTAVNSCFLFHILPNNIDIVFFEDRALKSIRNLEFEDFRTYINDSRLKKDDLLVIFLKKENMNSYSFFSVFSHERIGSAQFAFAILVNIICGFLLFNPQYKGLSLKSHKPSGFWDFYYPLEVNIALGIMILTIIYLIFPKLKHYYFHIRNLFLKK